MTNELQILINLGSPAVEAAISQYTGWHFTNAIVWMFSGLGLLFFAYKLFKSNFLSEKGDEFLKGLLCLIMFSIGFVLIFDNITNLIHPRAYAIHQLIVDVRGK